MATLQLGVGAADADGVGAAGDVVGQAGDAVALAAVAIGDHVVEEHRLDAPQHQIVVDDLVVLVERDLDAGVLQQVEGVGLVEGRDPLAAQVGQGPVGRAGPHRQGLGVDEVRARQEDRRGPGRRGLEAVAHHVDVAAAQERH
jgi:hypothetical protein